jgi:predicted metalloprotease with PDZ domain
MKHLAARGAVVLALGAGALEAADLTIRLDAREVARKRVHTDLTLAVTPGALALAFPKWLPGEHGPTGPLDSIIGLSIAAGGETLTWRRDPLDLYTLELTVPPGVERLEISLDTGLPTAGSGFTAAPTSSEQLAVLPMNQFVLLPRGRDAETISTAATILPPAGWSVACALATRPDPAGGVALEEAPLARLIDSPVQIGRYTRRVVLAGAEPRSDLEHAIALAADSPAALEFPDDLVTGYGRLVAESGHLFGSRMYRHYTWLLTLSDHVAHFGLEHHESSDNRREERALTDPELRPWVAQLLGHEYVHSWNGKYRRPRGLLSPDYQAPMDGSLLWVYEGLTEFWGDVLATRAGLLGPEQYREYLAAVAGGFDTEPGAAWRPLADTAVAAQSLYSAPASFGSSRRDTDFYEASIFLWLDVDAEIRARTGARASLDDFMRRFYAGASGAPEVAPYDEQDVVAALAAVAPADWRAFVHRHLDETGTAALFGALERSGWRLAYSPEKNAWVEYWQKRRKTTERQWSIGLRLDEGAVILDAIEDRAAAQAGAAPGMTVVAVDGRKFTAEALDAAIARAQAARRPIELLVENDGYYRTLEVAYADGPRYPHLMRVDEVPDVLSAVLAPAASN